MIQENLQNEEITFLRISPPVLNHLQPHLINFKLLVIDIVTAKENSNLMEFRHVQDTLKFIPNEEILALLTLLRSEKIAVVFFLHPTLEIESIS